VLSNSEVANQFALGKTRGKSNRMTIEGDTLYSYSAPIAIRDGEKFIISNRASFLGGCPYSMTTSHHISCVYYACKGKGTIRLVDGWAERGKPEFYIPQLPSYKTVSGLIRGFVTHPYWNGTWTGIWHPDTGTKEVHWRTKNDQLISPEGDVVAFREYIRQPCNKDCDNCLARFLCLSNKELFNGYVVTIIKDSPYFEKVNYHIQKAYKSYRCKYPSNDLMLVRNTYK